MNSLGMHSGDIVQWLGLFAFGLAATYVFYVVSMTLSIHRMTSDVSKRGSLSLVDDMACISRENLFILRVVVASVFFVIGFIAQGIVSGCLCAVGGSFLPTMLLNIAKRRRVAKFEEQLVSALELVSNGLKSGLTLQQSVELLVKELPPPISEEFGRVLNEVRLGVEFTQALANLAERLNSNITHILAAGVAVTKQCGGDLTVIFQNIASTIREQATIEGKLEAVTAQGRFQGAVLGCMPFALLILLYFIDREHVETLFGYQVGIWAVSAVVVMVILAQVWISRLLDIDV